MSHVEGFDDGFGVGVYGFSGRGGSGVVGQSSNIAVHGTSYSGNAVVGSTDIGFGVYGRSNSSYGVYGWSDSNRGVHGLSESYIGVLGVSRSDYYAAVYGESYLAPAVYGESYHGRGVSGYSNSSYGVYGRSNNGYGVYGRSDRSYGVYAESTYNVGLYATGAHNRAAYLEGNVEITGNLTKGGGSFKIDHPLDPANKYLSHSFVESPDMKNVYDGVVVLDRKGEAEIELPDWFGALNKNFRYQLTAIGAPGPNLYIAEEISDKTTNSTSNNKNSLFKIAGGTSGMKVSWQVTGIRTDPWANANRIEVEEDKPDKERGYYLHPDPYGQPEKRGISNLLFPEEKQELIINEKKPNL